MRSASRAEPSRERLCAVSVDLDEVPCYTAIHGLPPLDGPAAYAVYRRALPRLVELFDRLRLRATFFAIGRDLAHTHARVALRELSASGHEVGNHTYDHLYDLTLRSRDEMRVQVVAGADAIQAATGRRPLGFRAPGYTVDDTLLSVLSEAGVGYDSSVFPCPAYYGLKVAAIQRYRLRGRPTHSIVDHPRVLRAPADPYRIGQPYTQRGDGLLELPIAVTRDRSGRLPFIGTTVIMAGRRGAEWLCDRIVGRPLINLELHGIDAADATLDELEPLQAAQPDLRKPASEKLLLLEQVIEQLRSAGYQFVTLGEAAQHFGETA